MSSIYIHIPFCKQACHYCDFHFSTSLKKRDELVLGLIQELKMRKNELDNEDVQSIYFGGGTPSLLSSSELKSILEAVYDNYNIPESVEITLEANPDDLINIENTDAVFNEYQNLGINRLSIGIQSFYERDLKLMNRAHNAEEAKQCMALATKHFKNISVDLIYGIPGLSNTEWINNIDLALSFGVPHISSYALAVEPKTALDHFIKSGKIPEIDEAQTQEQFYILVEKLEQAGFIHYEISNFGKPGFFSVNNSSYWQGKSYIGIGPSAHSFNGKKRSWNISNNALYIKSILDKNLLPSESESLSKTDRFNEYIMTGLRTIWGVSLEKVLKEFGETYYSDLLLEAKSYLNQNLLKIEFGEEGEILKVTSAGKFLCDGIAADLFKLN